MAHVAMIVHNPEVGPGRILEIASDHALRTVDGTRGDFPAEVDAAVVLGGFMSAFEEADNPWLESEKSWIAEMVERGTPMLGICLGAQLLADSLGGRAFRADLPEVGVVPVELTEQGRDDPVTRHLGSQAFVAHQDSFELPPGATLLARTPRFPLAFRVGSALGVQSHPEVDTATALRWPDAPGFDMLERVGMDSSEFADGLLRHDTQLDSAAVGLLRSWFDTIRSDQRR